jgi:hypothetical protein
VALGARRLAVVGAGDAPLWEYFSRLLREKADESIVAPKGHGTPGPLAAFPLQTSSFQGPPGGAMIAIVDP